MKNLNVFLWVPEEELKGWEFIIDLGYNLIIYENLKKPNKRILHNANLAIIDENFEKLFDYPVPKIVLSKIDKKDTISYDNRNSLVKILNCYSNSLSFFTYLLPNPSFLMDKKGKILAANYGFLKLFYFDDVLGKNIDYFFINMKKKLWQRREKFFSFDINYYDRVKNKDYIFQLNFHKIWENYLISIEDVTIKRKKENLNFLISKAEAISKLAGGTAHDLNNLLMVISSYATLIGRKTNQVEIISFLNEINKAVEKSKELSGKLLAFSGKQTLEPKIINVEEFFKDFIENYKNNLPGNIKIELISTSNIPFIEIDREKFKNCIEKILQNSLEAMEEGGVIIIEISLKEVEKSCWEFPILPPGKWLQITITDTGSGMSPETLKRIFEPYFTTKPKSRGKGMGLAEVYGFIKQSGGFIFCTSEEKIGSSIFIFLKPQEGRPIPKLDKKEKTIDNVSFNGKVVLLIEDEKVLLSSLGMILASAGFEVIKSSSGEEAIEILKKMEGKLDLIISDVILSGMDGKEAVEKIQKIKPGTPAIFMSGYSDSILAKHNIIKNDINFISKPFNVDDLFKKISKVFSAS